MEREKDNWQDSPQTGREANRDHNSANPRKIIRRSAGSTSHSDNRDRRDDRSSSSYPRRDSGSYQDRRPSGGNRSYGNKPYGDRSDSSSRFSRPERRDERPGGYSSDRGQKFGERKSFTPRSSEDSSYERREDSREGGSYSSERKSFTPRGERFNRPQRSADYNPNDKYSKRKQIEYKQQFVDPTKPIRLNKYLANAGICSRREADELIESGSITVNGVVVTELGTKVMRTDQVKVNEKVAELEQKVYVLLNKPKDCVTTMDDPQERRTVMDLVSDACNERIYPVGRLDRRTTGVLLLTNDGDLASKLTHPKYEKKKIYHVTTDVNVTKNDIDRIAEGIELEDGLIKADTIGYVDDEKRNQVGLEIHSGKNRIVRRIFESLDYKVVKLDRVLFAGLTKKGLRRGEWRYLTEQEVAFLKMGSFD